MRAILIIAMLALVGCAQQIAERHHATCLSYGFQVGSSDYGHCRLALQQMRTQNYATAMQNYSNSLAIQRMATPRTTTCRQIGTTLYCN